jgi:hypothetical protein
VLGGKVTATLRSVQNVVEMELSPVRQSKGDKTLWEVTMEVLTALVSSFWFWVIGLPVIVWGGAELIQSWMKHKERMAMIERGMHPDRRKAEAAKQEVT